MKTGVYNAGPLFTEAEWNQRLKEGKELRDQLNKNLTIYNPADYDFNDSTAVRTNKIIFDYDYSTINKSNIAIFDIDGMDPGTFVEFGIYVEKAMHQDDIYIIAKLSDFRSGLSINFGEIPGYAVNGFLSGVFSNDKLMDAKPVPQIYVVRNSQEAIDTINAIDDVVTNNKKVDPIEFHKEHSKGWYVYQDKKKFNI